MRRRRRSISASCRRRGGSAAAASAAAAPASRPRRRCPCTRRGCTRRGVALEVPRVDLDARDRAARAEPDDRPVVPGRAAPLRLPAVGHVRAVAGHDQVVARPKNMSLQSTTRAAVLDARRDRPRPDGAARPSRASPRRTRAAARRRRRERCAGAGASRRRLPTANSVVRSPRRPRARSGASCHGARSRSARRRAAPGATHASIAHDSGKLPVKCACRRRRRASMPRAPSRTMHQSWPSNGCRAGRRAGGASPSRPSTCRGRCTRLRARRAPRRGSGVPSARRTRRWRDHAAAPSRSDARSTRSVNGLAHSSLPRAGARAGRDPRRARRARYVVCTTPRSARPAYGVSLCRCCRRAASTVNSPSGSQTTRSASQPGRDAALAVGQPASAAGAALIQRARSVGVRAALRRAPVHTAGERNSSDAMPPHARTKSPGHLQRRRRRRVIGRDEIERARFAAPPQRLAIAPRSESAART